MKKRAIRVAIADVHPVVRFGLRACLADRGRFDVVGEAADGEEALQLAAAQRPDVLVLDLDLRGLSGLEVARRLKRTVPRVRLLVLTAQEEPDMVERLIQSGGRGYVLKHSALGEIVRAIERVQAGETYFSPEVAGPLLTRGNRMKSGQLTNREREVLGLVADGMTTKAIAAELGVSERTALTHRQNLMTKLGLHNTAGLTRYAVAEGVVPLQPFPGGKAWGVRRPGGGRPDHRLRT